MKRAFVEWAQSHDWYVSCEQLPTDPGIWDGGEWIVNVREDEKTVSFESFIELSRWAGY